MTGFVLNINIVALHMTGFVLNITGIVNDTTNYEKKIMMNINMIVMDLTV